MPICAGLSATWGCAFAHASDFSIGQCLFADAGSTAGCRPEWERRWDRQANAGIVECVRAFASERRITERQAGLAWLLDREYPVVAIVGLPELTGANGAEYERAAELRLDESARNALRQARSTCIELDGL